MALRRFEGFEKGVNLGGWLSQCVHTNEHYDTFITEKDFAEISTWGLDHLRLPVDYNLIETEKGEPIESGMEYIRSAISWCRKYGLNMILGLHKTAGYSFDPGENEQGFFESPSLQERFMKLWERFSKEFGQYSDFVAFELLNEVTDKSYCEKWNQIAHDCIERIRKIAPDTRILVGGYWNNSIEAVSDLDMPYDDKIVYNFHCYEPLLFTHQGAYWVKNMPSDLRITYPGTVKDYMKIMKEIDLDTPDLMTEANVETVGAEFFEAIFAKAVAIAEERNVPLYCGEYGVIDLADPESTLNWYRAIHSAFVNHSIGRAAWSYKKMDFGLSDERMKPLFDEIKNNL